jgi:hypothetical protein
VARKGRRSRGHEPVQDSGSQPESRIKCGDRIRARREASMSRDTQQDRRAYVERTRTAVKAWPPDEKYQVLTKLPLRGVYIYLSSRGILVICPTQRDFTYIALGLEDNLSI